MHTHTHTHTHTERERKESQIEVIWKSKTQRSLGTRKQFRRKIDFQIEWRRVLRAGWLFEEEIVEGVWNMRDGGEGFGSCVK
jgi:hypothetical protein